MSTSSFGGNVFWDSDRGTALPAFCTNCRQLSDVYTGHTFKDNPPVNFVGNLVQCPKCGAPAQIIDGTYEFAKAAYSILKEAKYSRQQIRRFEVKSRKSKDIDDLAMQSQFINPAFVDLTLEAKKQRNPRAALKTIVTIGKWILATAAVAGSITSGVISADDVSDRWQRGELFEDHTPKSNKVEDQLQDEPKNEPSDEQPPSDPWAPNKSTDV